MRYLLLIVLLCGCSVSSSEISKAEELCKANGGVHKIDPFYQIIRCKNGAIF